MSSVKRWIAALSLAFGVLVIAAVVHDWVYPAEDSQIIWLCGQDGRGNCAPGQPGIQINWHNIWGRP